MKKPNTLTSFTIMFCLLCLGLPACKKETNSIKQNRTSSGTASNASAFASTSNEIIATDNYVNIPCANSGAGEDVHLTGPLHASEHLTINDNNFIFKIHYQPQDVKGVGQTTGLKYKATGETQYILKDSFTNRQYTETYTNNFRIIGQGPGNNYTIHENIHITINADGTVTSYVDNFIADCK